jgi:hypothetical protein
MYLYRSIRSVIYSLGSHSGFGVRMVNPFQFYLDYKINRFVYGMHAYGSHLDFEENKYLLKNYLEKYVLT